MRADWLRLCRQASLTPASYWSGDKKILRGLSYRFPDPLGPLTIEEVGYTPTKMSLLRKAYIHEESLQSARDQWNNRKNYKAKSHWSVGFTTYNHILKAHSKMEGHTGIGSVMGPCLQAVVITHMPNGLADIEVFYRTTELFKKFPADLVLIRDHFLDGFDFDRTPLSGMTIRVCNMTVNPTYVTTMLTLDKKPFDILEQIAVADPQLHRNFAKASLGVLDGPESTFNQTLRTQKAARELMDDDRQREMISYFRKHYPELKK